MRTMKFTSMMIAMITVISLSMISRTIVIAGETGASSGYLAFQKSERINSSRGGTNVVTRTLVGVSQAKEQGGPLDKAQFRCHMTFVVVSGSKAPATGSGYCRGISSAGDTWTMLLRGDEAGGKWTFLDGTGRYDMIKGLGTWQHKGSPRDNTERYEWDGKWELKN